MILNCENCYFFCEELISGIEMINCTKIRTTCKSYVNLAIVYRSKDIFFFLNEKSKKMRIRRSFSSHIMLKINKDQNDEFKEWEDFLLPEQFVFQINKDNKLDIKYIGFSLILIFILTKVIFIKNNINILTFLYIYWHFQIIS